VVAELGKLPTLGAEGTVRILLSVTLFCCGCTQYYHPQPSNEDLVKKAKICTDAGLGIHVVRGGDGWNADVLDFQCVPKGDR
jgi:hypothetical protein